jgi:hypothetical protein
MDDITPVQSWSSCVWEKKPLFIKHVHACKTCVGDDDRDTLYNRVLKWFLG